MTKTMKQMCDEIIEEMAQRRAPVLNLDGKPMTGEELYHSNQRGELSHIFHLYYALFPETLPKDDANPIEGSLRYKDGIIEAWTRGVWLPYMRPLRKAYE